MFQQCRARVLDWKQFRWAIKDPRPAGWPFEANALRDAVRCKPLLPITKTRMLKFALPAAAVLLTLAVAGAFAARGEYLSFTLSFIPLVTAVFMLGTAPGFWRGLNRPLNNKTRWAFQLHAFRSAVVGVTALSFAFMSFDISGEFFFVVLAFSMPYLFFGIPGTAGLIHVLIKDQPDAAVFRESGTVWASRLITHVSWAGSAAVIVLAVAVFQPWPFSLREGPDTEWAREGFEQTFGFAPPVSVEDLYCRRVSFWQSREVYAKFTYNDPEIARQILGKLRMEKGEPRGYQEIRRHFPSWWLQGIPEHGNATLEYHRRPPVTHAGEGVWIDRESKTLYYMYLD